MCRCRVSSLSIGKSKPLRLNVSEAPKDQEGQSQLRQDIQHTIEYDLTVGGNDVAAFADSKCDRIDDPEEDQVNGRVRVGPGNVRAQETGMAANGNQKRVGN
jgi:hypothetical protein